jgi:hypothetical protein
VIDCLACLRKPEHSVELEDGETVEFCGVCWVEVESRLDELGKQYRSLIAGGMHPLMAERRLNEATARQ